MTKCKNCGTSGQDGKFCEECGKSLKGGHNGSRGNASGVGGFGVYKTQVFAFAVVVMATLGIFTMLSSITAANSSASSDVNNVIEPSDTDSDVSNTDGYQEINMKLSGGFVPNTFTVNAGQPVKWTITGERVTGCVQDVVQRDFGVNVPISNGETKVVTFTPAKPGTYTFTCGMGMVRGTIKVVDPVTGIAPGPTGIGGAAGGSCGGGGGGCGCGG